MIDDRVDIKAGVIRVFDLAHDFPDHIVMRLPWRCLDLAVNTESHACLLLPLGRSRNRLLLPGEDVESCFACVRAPNLPVRTGRSVPAYTPPLRLFTTLSVPPTVAGAG